MTRTVLSSAFLLLNLIEDFIGVFMWMFFCVLRSGEVGVCDQEAFQPFFLRVAVRLVSPPALH